MEGAEWDEACNMRDTNVNWAEIEGMGCEYVLEGESGSREW